MVREEPRYPLGTQAHGEGTRGPPIPSDMAAGRAGMAETLAFRPRTPHYPNKQRRRSPSRAIPREEGKGLTAGSSDMESATIPLARGLPGIGSVFGIAPSRT